MISLLLAPYLENVKMGGSAKSAVEKKIILIKS